MNNTLKKYFAIFIIFIFVILGIFIYREYFHFKNFLALKDKSEQEKSEFQNIIFEIEKKLVEKEQELNQTNKDLQERNEQVFDMLEELENLDSGFKQLAKYIETDKELLSKYSKVYFLNENYTPKQISLLDKKYSISPDKEIYIHGQVKKFIENLIDDAFDDGIEIRIVSGYRSFDTQKSLKSSYLVQYGTGANAFSADQGYSEHQLGTAVDFSNPTLGSNLTISFEQSKSFAWLMENAHKYGFTLSYPKGNQFYQYEPWHWRFVGVDLATHLFKEEIYFYDMDQREINKYLANIFD
jgi:zinc D-Ala-D-Ala carboxypeptidase